MFSLFESKISAIDLQNDIMSTEHVCFNKRTDPLYVGDHTEQVYHYPVITTSTTSNFTNLNAKRILPSYVRLEQL